MLGFSESGYLKVKIRLCCGCLQKLCKMCLQYCSGTSNYSKINSHASKEKMVTLVSQTRSKECLLSSFSIYMTYDVIHVTLCVFVKSDVVNS